MLHIVFIELRINYLVCFISSTVLSKICFNCVILQGSNKKCFSSKRISDSGRQIGRKTIEFPNITFVTVKAEMSHKKYDVLFSIHLTPNGEKEVGHTRAHTHTRTHRAAVSYTHLDVYKRQASLLACRSSLVWEARNRFLFRAPLVDLPIDARLGGMIILTEKATTTASKATILLINLEYIYIFFNIMAPSWTRWFCQCQFRI